MLSCLLSVDWLSFTYASVGLSLLTSAGMQRTLFTFPSACGKFVKKHNARGPFRRSLKLQHFADSCFSSACLTLWASLTCLCRWLCRCWAKAEKRLGHCQSICIQSIIATSIRQTKTLIFPSAKNCQLPGHRVRAIGRLMRKFQLAKLTNI